MDLSHLSKDELAHYLKTNKSTLIAAKKADIKYTSSIINKPHVIAKREVREVKEEATKDSNTPTDPLPVVSSTTLDVKVVCNAAWFCDLHMDVITDTAYDSSVAANAINLTIPHIADHKQTSTSHVGDVTAFYTEVMPLKDLGLDQVGSTTALVMETTIRQDYNADVFKFYQNGKIDQHSIGLRYNGLDIAINNATEDYAEEKALWDQYYPNVINKDLVDSRGYFYVINDMTVVENSCVLFGANSLTPTLSIKSDQVVLEVKEEVLLPKEVVQEEVLNLSTKPIGIIMTTEEKYIALMAEHDTLKASVALDVGKAIQTERQRCVKGIEAAKTFGISEATVVKALTKGYSLETMSDMFTDLAEAKGEQTAIKTSAGSLGSADADLIAATKAAEEAAKPDSMESDIMKGFEELGKTENLFKGIR